MIIIPIKWLFHWEYTLFSDKPIYIYIYWIGQVIGTSLRCQPWPYYAGWEPPHDLFVLCIYVYGGFLKWRIHKKTRGFNTFQCSKLLNHLGVPPFQETSTYIYIYTLTLIHYTLITLLHIIHMYKALV